MLSYKHCWGILFTLFWGLQSHGALDPRNFNEWKTLLDTKLTSQQDAVKEFFRQKKCAPSEGYLEANNLFLILMGRPGQRVPSVWQAYQNVWQSGTINGGVCKRAALQWFAENFLEAYFQSSPPVNALKAVDEIWGKFDEMNAPLARVQIYAMATATDPYDYNHFLMRCLYRKNAYADIDDQWVAGALHIMIEKFGAKAISNPTARTVGKIFSNLRRFDGRQARLRLNPEYVFEALLRELVDSAFEKGLFVGYQAMLDKDFWNESSLPSTFLERKLAAILLLAVEENPSLGALEGKGSSELSQWAKHQPLKSEVDAQRSFRACERTVLRAGTTLPLPHALNLPKAS